MDRGRSIRVIKYMLFSASICPALVAAGMAWQHCAASERPFPTLAAVLVTVGLFLGQAGGDYFYFHFTNRHTDARDAHTKVFAGWRPLFTGTLIPEQLTPLAGAVCLLAAAGIGSHFFLVHGYPVLFLAAAGGLVALAFTPLMRLGLKEPVIFLTFGPLSVAGAYYVMTGSFRAETLWASIPVGLLITLVAYLKSTRVVMEEGAATVSLRPGIAALLAGLAFASVIGFTAAGLLPAWALLVLVALPLAVVLLLRLRPKRVELPIYLRATVTALLLSASGSLLLAGAYGLDALLWRAS